MPVFHRLAFVQLCTPSGITTVILRRTAGFRSRVRRRPAKNSSAAPDRPAASPPTETAPISDAHARKNSSRPPAACIKKPSLFFIRNPSVSVLDGTSITEELSQKTDNQNRFGNLRETEGGWTVRHQNNHLHSAKLFEITNGILHARRMPFHCYNRLPLNFCAAAGQPSAMMQAVASSASLHAVSIAFCSSAVNLPSTHAARS